MVKKKEKRSQIILYLASKEESPKLEDVRVIYPNLDDKEIYKLYKRIKVKRRALAKALGLSDVS